MIYIAGPFFTDKERAFLKTVIESVKKFFPNEELFIPMEHFIPNGENLSNNEWAEAVFKMDVEALNKCNHVVAPCFYVEVESDLFAYFMEKCSEIQTSFPSKKLLLGILEGIRELDEKGFEQIDGFEGNILLKKGSEVVISDFSSFAVKNQNSVRNQIEKMLEYVGSKRNIKKLTNHIKEKKVKYDISNIKECIEKLVK